MYSKTTNKINITVRPFYLEDQSAPNDNHYVWSYQITINTEDIYFQHVFLYTCVNIYIYICVCHVMCS